MPVSTFPVHNAPALIAGRQWSGGIGAFAAGRGLHLTRDLQMTAATLAAADRDDRRQIARSDPIVNL